MKFVRLRKLNDSMRNCRRMPSRIWKFFETATFAVNSPGPSKMLRPAVPRANAPSGQNSSVPASGSASTQLGTSTKAPVSKNG